MIHPGHIVPPWTAALCVELVAAFRRGSMSAERCLRTYQSQGERSVLPPEAVAYLAARVVADRAEGRPGRGGVTGLVSAEALVDEGHRELAELFVDDREAFNATIEAGRRVFFPSRQSVG